MTRCFSMFKKDKGENPDPDIRIREQLKVIAQISNAHALPDSKERLDIFNEAIKEAKFCPLTRPLFEYYILLVIKGTTKKLDKKKFVNKYYPKIILKKNTVEKKDVIEHGHYKHKHSIHIFTKDKEAMLATVLHEIVHYIIKIMTGTVKPLPQARWEKLAEDLKKEPNPKSELSIKKMKKFQDYKLDTYKGCWTEELPARLAETALIHNELLTDKEVKSSLVKEINYLYKEFIKDVEKQIILINKEEKSSNFLNPIEIYKKIAQCSFAYEESSELVKQIPDAKTMRTMGIYPIHIATANNKLALLSNLLAHYPLDLGIHQIDKHNKTPLKVAADMNHHGALLLLKLRSADSEINGFIELISKLSSLTQIEMKLILNQILKSIYYLQIVEELANKLIYEGSMEYDAYLFEFTKELITQLAKTYRIQFESKETNNIKKTLTAILEQLIGHQHFLRSKTAQQAFSKVNIQSKQKIVTEIIATLNFQGIIRVKFSPLSFKAYQDKTPSPLSDGEDDPSSVLVIEIDDSDELNKNASTPLLVYTSL